MGTVELVCTVLFTLDYLARWYAAEHRGAYIFSFYALIDVVTILPVYAQSIIEAAPSVGSIGDETEQFLRPIRVSVCVLLYQVVYLACHSLTLLHTHNTGAESASYSARLSSALLLSLSGAAAGHHGGGHGRLCHCLHRWHRAGHRV